MVPQLLKNRGMYVLVSGDEQNYQNDTEIMFYHPKSTPHAKITIRPGVSKGTTSMYLEGIGQHDFDPLVIMKMPREKYISDILKPSILAQGSKATSAISDPHFALFNNDALFAGEHEKQIADLEKFQTILSDDPDKISFEGNEVLDNSNFPSRVTEREKPQYLHTLAITNGMPKFLRGIADEFSRNGDAQLSLDEWARRANGPALLHLSNVFPSDTELRKELTTLGWEKLC